MVVSLLILIFWILAIVSYSWPNSQEKVTWHVNSQDGIFAWPISISNRTYKSELVLGIVIQEEWGTLLISRFVSLALWQTYAA